MALKVLEEALNFTLPDMYERCNNVINVITLSYNSVIFVCGTGYTRRSLSTKPPFDENRKMTLQPLLGSFLEGQHSAILRTSARVGVAAGKPSNFKDGRVSDRSW